MEDAFSAKAILTEKQLIFISFFFFELFLQQEKSNLLLRYYCTNASLIEPDFIYGMLA